MLEQFAQHNSDRIKIVGIGAQDDLAFAERFVVQTGITFTMLWDPTFDSWNHYGVRSNSSSWLLDHSGERVGEVFSGLNEAYVEELLASI